MKSCFILSILLLFFIQPVFSQRIILKDEQTAWRVALAEFKISSSREDISYISNILPLFFFSQLSGISTHTLSSEEILLFRKKIVSDQINAEEQKLSSYIKEYDSAYFRDTGNRRDIRNNIRDSQKRIRQLQKYNLERIRVSNIKDIEFITTNEADNRLSFDILDIDNFANKNNFEYILYGSARQFENILILEIKFYSTLEKKDIYSTSVTTETENLFLSLENVISEITSILLGTTWSRITVNTDTRSSDIYLNEKYIGTGAAVNILTAPGEHTVTIRGTGQEEKTISVFLDEKKTTVIDLNVTLREEKLTVINTIPQEANIYLDSLWMGVTPLLLNGFSGEIIIRKDGFRETRLLLDDISQNSIEIQLSPDVFLKKDFITKKRNSFYTSLSFFVISVPISFFLYAAASEYNSAYNSAITSVNLNYDEINRLGRIKNYTYYGYHASLFLTISLFANTLFRLSDYIKAGDVLDERK